MPRYPIPAPTPRYSIVTSFQIWGLLFIFGLLVYWLQFNGRMPSVQGWHSFVDSLNSRGGNIFILVVLSIWLFKHSMNLFYYVMGKMNAASLGPQDAPTMMALQFVTGSAGAAFGALLKTMTSQDSRGRSGDGDGDPGVNGRGVPPGKGDKS